MRFLLFFWLMTEFCFPRTFFIDSSYGSDSNTGATPNTAWKSFSNLNSLTILPGYQILLKSGCTFSGPLIISASGTPANPVIIGAYGNGPAPEIQGPQSSAGLRLDKTSYVIVKGIKISDAKFGINFIRARNIIFQDLIINNSGWSGGYGDNVTNIIIRSSIFQNSRLEHGIYFGGKSHNVLIERSIFRNNGKSGIHFNCDADASPSYNAVVRFNIIEQNKQYGINNTATKNSYFYYNIVSSNETYGFQFEYDIHASGNSPDSNKVFNNIFYNNTGPGVFIASKLKGNSVINNIFHQGSQMQYLISDRSNGLNNTFSNNLYYGTNTSGLWAKHNSLLSSYSDWSSVSDDRHSSGGKNSVYDPLFADPQTGDFKLLPGSPALQKGMSVGIKRDFSFSPVPLKPELGAFQFSND